jgi:hypothetical protein
MVEIITAYNNDSQRKEESSQSNSHLMGKRKNEREN